ncbi:MAG: hypothetical protein AAF620_00185 [Bacteroidota bacterium]
MPKVPIGVLLTDTHLTKNNTSDIEEVWKQCIDLCQDLKVRRIFHGGDMVTARAAQPLNVLLSISNTIRALDDADIEVDAILGNHDLVNQEAFEGYPSIFDSKGFRIHGIHEILRSPGFGKVVIHMLSYFPEKGSYKDRVEAIKGQLDKDKFNLLITHVGINGGLAHANATTNKEVPAALFDGFDKVLVGHYHNQCQIEGYEIYYVGSTHQQNFGEDVNKGFTILYDDGSHKFIKSEMPEYHTYRRAVEEAGGEFLHQIATHKKKHSGDRIRVILTGDESKLKTIDKLAFAEVGTDRLQLKEESVAIRGEERQASFVSFDKELLIKEYGAFCVDQELEKELGLDYLKAL